MNRCTSNGTYICRSLNYYVGLFAASNNRATTTNKVKGIMKRVLGWSPWQWAIHWSLSHQQRGLGNHGIFFNGVVPWEISTIKKKLTTISLFFFYYIHISQPIVKKIVLLTSEFNCSRHLIGQFLFCRDYFLSNCDRSFYKILKDIVGLNTIFM
jgi:hypothetical protein